MYCIFRRILGQNTAFTNLKARYNVLFKGEGKCLNQACCNISLEDSLQPLQQTCSKPVDNNFAQLTCNESVDNL